MKRFTEIMVAFLVFFLFAAGASADPEWIFGMHDSGCRQVRDEMEAKGIRGWIVFTEEIGHDPDKTSGKDYQFWSNAGHGVIVRLNNGYGNAGTLPYEEHYDDFATRCANYIEASQGAHIWIIGNEPNLPREWPGNINGDSNSGEAITVARYVSAYDKVWNELQRRALTNEMLVPAPSGPYAPPLDGTLPRLPNRGIPGFKDYWVQVLNALGSTKVGGLAIHAYTHGSNPDLVFSNDKMGWPYEDIYYHFRVYQNYMWAIPSGMRNKPVWITETDQSREVSGYNWDPDVTGWIQNAYDEINQWNLNDANQKIRALIPFRWNDAWEGDKNYCIPCVGAALQDWRDAMNNDYRWTNGDSPPPPPSGEDDEIINALSNAPEVGGDRPWEGEGITAAWVNSDGNLGVISKDRFWVLRLSDLSWIAWNFFSSLSSNHVWMQAAHDYRVDYQRPWEGAGLTAGWVNGDNYLGATSKDKYWVQDLSSRQWIAWGKYAHLPSSHLWKQAPRVEGQYPWEGSGITAGWFEDSNGWVVSISKNRYWTQDFSNRTWRWWGRFDDLASDHTWKRAPEVDGLHPWEGDGITAGFVAEDKLYVFSRDRYWVRRLSDDRWIASGHLGEGDTQPPPPPPSGRTDQLHGTILDCQGNREANIYVSVWRHDGGQFLTTYTNSSGIYEFHGLDPNQLYNLAVNVEYHPDNCDCCPFRRVDPGRNSAVRNNVELIDGGDGWHGENFWLCTPCPQ